MSTSLRQVENYEVSVIGEAGSDGSEVLLSFDISDTPGIPHGSSSAHLVIGDDGYGDIVVSFEDSRSMEDIAFIRCPPGVIQILEKFSTISVAALPPDGEKITFHSTVGLSTS